jgi:hypothetical protein
VQKNVTVKGIKRNALAYYHELQVELQVDNIRSHVVWSKMLVVNKWQKSKRNGVNEKRSQLLASERNRL